jgi:hypothetical protein
VILTGAGPYAGPGLPVNLVTRDYTRTGFGFRALDQAGAPLSGRLIRLHYWATTQGATPNTRAGRAVVLPDARGAVLVPWSRFAVGLPATSVVLTGTAPTSGPAMPVNLLVSQARSDGAHIRVLDQTGRPVTTPVTVAYYATKQAASEI